MADDTAPRKLPQVRSLNQGWNGCRSPRACNPTPANRVSTSPGSIPPPPPARDNIQSTLSPASLTTLPLSFPSQPKRTRKPGHTPRITAHRRQSYTHILPRVLTSPFDPATPPKRLPTARTAAALPRAPPRTTPATPTPPPPGSRPSPLCHRPVWEAVSAARRRHLRRRGSLAQ